MTRPRALRKAIKVALVGVGAFFVVAQLVPYGRRHSNPPVVKEPHWDQPRTRELALRACFDCHSNETRWPWYSSVAPISWLVQYDVDEGRRLLDFSEWHRSYEEAGDSAESILEGEMPPWTYLTLHREARLSSEEKNALAQGLSATLGATTREHD
jgi:hypothetical protein